MVKNTYINLPVADLGRTRAFFEALGFAFDKAFSDETALGMHLGGTTYAMLMTRTRFADFTPLPVADAATSSQTLIGLQLETRTAVDEMTVKALAAGASAARPPKDHGFMYERAFADLDGHIWEPFWMNPDAMGGAA